jgi:hypothetical protein
MIGHPNRPSNCFINNSASSATILYVNLITLAPPTGSTPRLAPTPPANQPICPATAHTQAHTQAHKKAPHCGALITMTWNTEVAQGSVGSNKAVAGEIAGCSPGARSCDEFAAEADSEAWR